METFSSRKVIWGVVVIAALALIATFVLQLRTDYYNNSQTAQTPPPFSVETTDVPADQLPQQFPAELPIEVDAQALENFNSTSNSDNLQATRKYESTNI